MKCRRVYATLAATVFALSAGASAREFVLPLGTLLQRMMNEPNSWHASGTHRGFPRRQQAVLPSGGRGKDPRACCCTRTASDRRGCSHSKNVIVSEFRVHDLAALVQLPVPEMRL